MKTPKILEKIIKMPRKFLALLIIGLFIAPLAAGIVDAANQATMEGHTKALNVTAGETVYKDVTEAKVNDVVQVQLWHHNREMPTGTKANNTIVKFSVPTAAGKSQVITGTTSSDNSNTITDTTQVNLSLDRAHLEYVPGTAKFRYNKGAAEGDKTCQTGMEYPAERCYATVKISDDVVKGGVNLDKVRGGPLTGCNAYHETVTIQVRSLADAVSVNKYVRHAGQTSADWKTSTTAKPGDDIEYMIRFKNEGNTTLNNVIVADNLPKYNAYVPGTTMLKNTSNPNGVSISNDNINKGGINVGHYQPGSVAYVMFKVKLDKLSVYERCGEYVVRNVGIVKPAGMSEYYNTAEVKIQVKCDTPTPPTYSCDLLTAEKISGRTVKFTAKASAANGAVIKNYVYTYGDGGETTSNDTSVTHTYAQDGTYTAKVRVAVQVGNEVKYAEGPQCQVQVKFETPPTPAYSCDLLKAEKIGGRTMKLTANATASGGATIKEYTFVYGDGQQVTTNLNAVSHTYPSEGNSFTAKVRVAVQVGNEVKYAEGPQCEVKIHFDVPQPVYSCDLLQAQKTGGRSVKFTASATATNGAIIKNYIFNYGDGSEELTSQNVANHTYVKDGKYLATVAVQVLVNGQTKIVEGPNCKAEVEFKSEPEKPVYSCDLLTAKKTGNGREVKFTAKATAYNGATIKRYIFNYGDGSEEFTTDKNVATHTYKADGQYAAVLKVQFMVGDELVTEGGDNCATSVSFNTPETPEVPEEPLTPNVLPETGAGSVIATFLAVSGLGTLGYYVLSRRSARI